MPLEFLNSILVNDGFLKGRFELKEPMFSLFPIGDGSSLFNANLEMAHECINGGLFVHGLTTKPVPHESLPSFPNGRLIICPSMDWACVSGWSSNGVAV